MSAGLSPNTTQMDPATKIEIWLFQKIGRVLAPGSQGADKHGYLPIYRRLPYNLVRYDGDTVEYIEPVSSGLNLRLFDIDANRVMGDPVNPLTDGAGRMCGARYYDARPFEMFAYNDVDVANNLGQLP